MGRKGEWGGGGRVRRVTHMFLTWLKLTDTNGPVKYDLFGQSWQPSVHESVKKNIYLRFTLSFTLLPPLGVSFM